MDYGLMIMTIPCLRGGRGWGMEIRQTSRFAFANDGNIGMVLEKGIQGIGELGMGMGILGKAFTER